MSSRAPQTHSALAQTRIERHTLALLRTPEVEAARDKGAAALFASIPDADAASRERFPQIAEEITLNALVGLADGYTGEDLPRLIMRVPRQIDGERVPGNRGLHDNPDTFYRLIPLDGQSDFVLEGHVGAHPATIFELSGLTASWNTFANLTKADLTIEPGSAFRVSFRPDRTLEVDGPGQADSEPPSDVSPTKRHAVRVPADAEMLLVRETLADWSLERPCRLTITNYVDRGGPREADDVATVSAAAARVEKWFSESIRLTQVPLSQPANFFPSPVISGEHGKLVTMAYSIGHFWIRPGEALVLTIDPGTAAYVGVPITNLWGTTNPNLAETASWNSHQVDFNHDGTFTCVLALEDPGVHNWLDPDGLERGFLFMRWAGLGDPGADGPSPALQTRVVSIQDLKEALPPETRWSSPEERSALREQRRRDHAGRFKEFASE